MTVIKILPHPEYAPKGAEIQVTLRGQPVHASNPDKGFNAIYGMTKIIEGVQALNAQLPVDKFLGKATIAVTHIDCGSRTGCTSLTVKKSVFTGPGQTVVTATFERRSSACSDWPNESEKALAAA